MKLFACALLLGLMAAGGPATAVEAGAPPLARFSADGYRFFVPQQPDFFMGTAQADLRGLHFEGRYNYEALHAGSVFVGLNLGWGTSLKLDLTPMVGAVIGDLDGIAPGWRLTLSWWRFDLSSASDIVIPFSGADGSYFYDWTELGFTPLGMLRVGGVIQHNRIFQNSLALQRGLFGSIRLGPFSFTLYELNAGWISATYIAALGITL